MIGEIKREIDERVSRLVVEHIANLLTNSDDSSDIFEKYSRYLNQYVHSKLLLHHNNKIDNAYYDAGMGDFLPKIDSSTVYCNMHIAKNKKDKLKKQLIFSGDLNQA